MTTLILFMLSLLPVAVLLAVLFRSVNLTKDRQFQ